MILIIALLAAIGWLVKDCIKAKSLAPVKQNWKKYVGCLVAGLLYGFLSGLTFFRWLAIVAVIALVANSFDEVLTFLNWFILWIRKALGKKS
jgi:predicted lipid-binding transport protein (Tim44 family)